MQIAAMDGRFDSSASNSFLIQEKRKPTYLILASRIVRPRSTYQVIIVDTLQTVRSRSTYLILASRIVRPRSTYQVIILYTSQPVRSRSTYWLVGQSDLNQPTR
jgi:hypothetical protein